MAQITISDLFENPDHYYFGLDGSDVLFLQMNRDCYARSIFFDDRIVTVHDNPLRVPLTSLLAAAAQYAEVQPRIGWIFHMAHTGSTLLARALDRPGKNLVIREPGSLRGLGVEASALHDSRAVGAGWNALLKLALAMLDKRYAADEHVLVKANVPVNAIIDDLLAVSSDPKALLLHFGLNDYLVAILRSPNHRNWVNHIFVEMQLGKLPENGPADNMQIAEKAAALWLFQIRRYAEVLSSNAGVVSLDANILFDEPALCLKAASEYFGCAMDDDEVRKVIAGPLFSTYSKNPNAAFDNRHRKQRVAETRLALGEEIAVARRWVEQRVAKLPLPERLARPLCGENASLL